jgi:hypothetical protein
MKYFIREDGSSNHIIEFDAMTGEFVQAHGGQGCFTGSSWTRGQAWGIYGFALSYRYTRNAEYLDTAKRIINGLDTAKGTNLEGGLLNAYNLLTLDSYVSDIAGITERNVVLLSDGAPSIHIGDNDNQSSPREEQSACFSRPSHRG